MTYSDFRNEPSRRERPGWLIWPLVVTGIIIAVCIVFWLIWWAIVAIFPDAAYVQVRDTQGMLQWMLFPGGLPTPFFWLLLSILVGIIVILFGHSRNTSSIAPIVLAWILAGLMIVGASTLSIVKAANNDDLASNHYLATTTFKVSDTSNLPSILGKYADNGTLEVKIEEGELPTSWIPRVASLTGAVNVMKKTSDAVNSTNLMDDTFTYLYGEGDSGVWTAIRNGANQQNIYGVASWNGTGERVDTCRFTGDYSLNKAFDGMYGKNLWNVVANTYPSFYFDQSDMWGYCDGNEPIIVIPGIQLGYTDMRSIDKTAGLVTIQGTRGGTPFLEMHTDVKPGEFPGPVYPQRLVNSQRESLDWAAGWWQSVNEHFGFNVTDVESQAGNNSNYLMKNEADGRLYWVTPLKPQDSDSQTLIAYSMVPADEVSSSVINPQIVYVLNEDDSRVVNLDDLLARVKTSVCDVDQNFCSADGNGNIVEFLPVSDTKWQVFAEISGRVKYRIDVDVDARIDPRIVDVDSGETANAPEPGEEPSCDDPSVLTEDQIIDCVSALVGELDSRSDK